MDQSTGRFAGEREALGRLVDRLVASVDRLCFNPPVTAVYDPLSYARASFDRYLDMSVGTDQVLLVGMNPGPWGMAQTGVPFGEVELVHRWMGIDAPIGHPPVEHPKRPVLGWECQRSEVSGARLWGWARERFGTPRAFFEQFMVWNYCPLVFMEESGKNRTPDKLPAAERSDLFAPCDAALAGVVDIIEPRMVIGVGAFAAKKVSAVVGGSVSTGMILHPSPASPIANRGWADQAERQLTDLGVALPGADAGSESE
ncbi:MAG: single-stranded DNA-binding protein [Actinobacteria bacterium]|nr:single-stranded DNA-binding protein [Actinomycetota bacterium]